ncbi:hypothetical protein [Paracraurococcus lichenis]|uniref:HIRAN domain-containing protein n=1 Tax=Paracraurococcus lichenis TaxID=3064888 RepID=A0ABT9E8A2_9PROT|nr:hypothetical protein [Paracraurococcus sp. LOR1-02]MDO9712420.1 hypothetical protein [Paracraurococcus sp. LOR1-02]
MPIGIAAAVPALFHSFISGIGERAAPTDLARLRPGLTLALRRAGRPQRGFSIEVILPEGAPLGWLPREDEAALEALGLAPDAATVRVAGIVPAFQRPRVHIEIAGPAMPAVVPAA